jgi:hypothetical protein
VLQSLAPVEYPYTVRTGVMNKKNEGPEEKERKSPTLCCNWALKVLLLEALSIVPTAQNTEADKGHPYPLI